MRLGLRLRFILLISTILLIIFALTAFFLVRNASNSLTNNLNQQSRAFASLATKPIGDTYALYKDSGTLRIDQQMSTFAALDTNIDSIVITSVIGQQLFEYGRTAPIVTPNDAASFDTVTHVNSSNQISQITAPYFDDSGQHPYAITYHVSTAALAADIQREVLSIVIFSLLGLVISAVATYEFVNIFFLRPIKKVSEMSAVIAGGYYSQEIALARSDEIGDLARSVNRMAHSLKANIDELQALDKVKNEFIMITSHNLRTPLTIIEGNLSILQMNKLPDNIDKMLKDIEESAESLNSFSEQMLTIASIEVGNQAGAFSIIKLRDVLEALQRQFELTAKFKKIDLSFDTSHNDVQLQADARQLRGAISNLIDNALKFTPEGGKITVGTTVDGGKLVLTVSDTGAGIKADEIPKLFTKFHRGTSTLTYNYKGTGIGLYAAKLIITQHKGTITVASEEGKGTTFTITLPLVTKTKAETTTATPSQ